jgi:hypothetical protein
MNLCSTRLRCLGLEAARSGPQQAKREPPDEERVNSSGHDGFPELEGVPSVRFHNTAKGEDEGPEWSVRRWVPASFLPCRGVEVFPNEFGSLSAAESSSMVARGRVAVCESWDASEMMVISMSSLGSPLAADPEILMSFLRCVPVIRGSRLL